MALAEIDLNAVYIAATPPGTDKKNWFGYTADDSTVYAVYLSEAIGTEFGFTVYGSSDTIPKALPRRFKMRHVHAKSSDGKTSGNFPVGKNTEDIYKSGGTIKVGKKGVATGITLTATGVTGEARTFAKAA